ncbi:MAG: nitroreductase family protein [Armatimonadota bacterium]|nr:nitroreductase family protein [bacterium]
MQDGVTIDTLKCTGCGLCMDVCLLGGFETGVDGKARLIEGTHCIKCGHCVAACPTMAITHSALPDLEDAPSRLSRLSYDQLMGHLKARRSRREFKSDSVPDDVIEQLLAAAVQAPNALNKQMVHYTVITNKNVLKRLCERAVASMRKLAGMFRSPVGKFVFRIIAKDAAGEMADLMPEVDHILSAYESGQDVILYNAPCAILVHTPKSDMCGPENSVYCAANILLAAESLGLGACVIGFITGPSEHDPDIKRTALVPADHRIHTTIALGYPKFDYSRPAHKIAPKVHFIS